MKAQYLSNVEIIIFSSLIIFLCKKSCIACCVCLYAPVTKKRTWLSTNTVSLWQILRLYWRFCLLNAFWLCLFCFQVIFMTCVEDNRIASVKLKLVKENFAFPKNKMIGHCNKHIQLDDYGECKDGCAYWVNTCLRTKKKLYESWQNKTRKRYFWHIFENKQTSNWYL